jgi:hypothetical protein
MGRETALRCDCCKRLLVDRAGVTIVDGDFHNVRYDASRMGWRQEEPAGRWFCRECIRIKSVTDLVVAPPVAVVDPRRRR